MIFSCRFLPCAACWLKSILIKHESCVYVVCACLFSFIKSFSIMRICLHALFGPTLNMTTTDFFIFTYSRDLFRIFWGILESLSLSFVFTINSVTKSHNFKKCWLRAHFGPTWMSKKSYFRYFHFYRFGGIYLCMFFINKSQNYVYRISNKITRCQLNSCMSTLSFA